jgi:hypothetical protein
MNIFSNHSPPHADSPSANAGQSILNHAATFPVSGKECGALPRRRYARKVLKLTTDLGSQSGARLVIVVTIRSRSGLFIDGLQDWRNSATN